MFASTALSCLPCGSYFFLEVLAEGRKRLGFNQEWMPDSDFKCLGSRDLHRHEACRHPVLKDLQLRGRGSRPSEG